MLEEYIPLPKPPVSMSENGAHIVVLSAKNQDRLKAIVQQQLDY
ncbi:hypothetical protein [Bacillus subtilis]|nr:hypothetical protein [Bacillus subtilis]